MPAGGGLGNRDGLRSRLNLDQRVCGVYNIFMIIVGDVDPAFQLRPAPAARPRIIGVQRQAGARLASDALIAALIERKNGNVERLQIFPNIARRPGRHGADLTDHLPVVEREVIEYLQIDPAGGLLAPQS